MAYTCPDCLRTSHHPQDEKNSYCGNCHEFKQGNVHYELTELQLAVAKVLQGFDPKAYLLNVVAQHFRTTEDGWDGILLQLLPLYNASRMTTQAAEALTFTVTRVAQMTNVVPPSE